MSSIAVPKRTEADLRRELTDVVRTLLAAAILTILLMTVTPFETVAAAGSAEGGNIVNQLGYGLLALVSIAGLLLFCERSVLVSLLRPTWALMAVWLVASASQAADPQAALRALAFALAAMIAAMGALCLPPNLRSFRLALTIAALVVLGLCYFGIVAMPGSAIHTADGPEGHHAGLWRGLYSHKNIAGAVMASLFFVGLYLLRCRQWITGGAVFALSLVFVLQTGSKTAAALLPAVALMVMSARLLGGRIVPALVLALALLSLALVTIGTVVIPAMDTLVQHFFPGTTFTGRTDLWRFAIGLWSPRQWTGFGFESFWRTGIVLDAEPSRELAWDPRGATNAHNGYLDIAIAAGLPGLFLAIAMLVVLPLADFVRAGRDHESGRLADMFVMILAFALMNAFLESFLFERGNPVWMTLWISVVGLRLLARHRLAEES